MTDSGNRVTQPVEDIPLDSVDFRHLTAFQRVYQEKSYSLAGHGVLANRKSVVRMMRNLERSFDCLLFTEGARGILVPSPFATRLFNDLCLLVTARHRMRDHIEAIHEGGRIVHVGSSPGLFRTLEFRTFFRELQALDGIRACYSPIDSEDAGKALVSGHCDLFIGCWRGKGSRFVTREAGGVSYRIYRRGSKVLPESRGDDLTPAAYVVSLHGQLPELPASPDSHHLFQCLDESRWLYWLDHPEECPDGTLIIGPEVQVDSKHWHAAEKQPATPVLQRIHVSFLRQHPYEFLPTLAEKIKNRALA